MFLIWINIKMKKISGFLIALSTIGFCALLGAQNANATSLYDDVISTGSLYAKHDTCEKDITSSFGSVWTNSDNWIDGTDANYTSLKTKWDTAVTNGTGWALVEMDMNASVSVGSISFDSNDNYYRFYFSESSTISAQFTYSSDYGVNVVLPTENINFLNMVYTDNGTECALQVFGANTANSKLYSVIASEQLTAYRAMPIFINMPITYPTDYEGVSPADSVVLVEDSEEVPDMYVSVANDWNTTFSDKKFFTFDETAWLCSDDLVPVLHLEVWDTEDDPNVLITSGSSSASSEWTYQFDKVNYTKEYRLLSWYECGDSPVFTEVGSYDFKINGTGTLYTVGLETCLQEDFPYFSYNSCISGINDMLFLLTFQMDNPANNDLIDVATNANPNGCHTLGTLGQWIHQEDVSICPAFSSEIRNIITPFITFVLGGLVFYWITRGRGVILE